MDKASNPRASSPREIFEQQIDHLRHGDRAGQPRLYADDLVYEFPFAVDRPRRLVGVEQFRRVMEPLWSRGDALGMKIVDYRGEIHEAADDPELIFAEFTFSVEAGSSVSDIEFVQKMRIKDGKILSVREYFSPGARARFGDDE